MARKYNAEKEKKGAGGESVHMAGCFCLVIHCYCALSRLKTLSRPGSISTT
jgi:hypothetical protein